MSEKQVIEYKIFSYIDILRETLRDIKELLSKYFKKFINFLSTKNCSDIIDLLIGIIDNLIRGRICEVILAELYPSIRWNFQWRSYIVVVGIPDGITDDFVYEFKCISSRFISYYEKPVAKAQADIYGYFFRRVRKKLHLFIIEDCSLDSIEDSVDVNNALDTLNYLSEVEQDISKAKSLKLFKCRRREFKNTCEVFHRAGLYLQKRCPHVFK